MSVEVLLASIFSFLVFFILTFCVLGISYVVLYCTVLRKYYIKRNWKRMSDIQNIINIASFFLYDHLDIKDSKVKIYLEEIKSRSLSSIMEGYIWCDKKDSSYHIHIDIGRSTYALIRVLAHEFVHAKQLNHKEYIRNDGYGYIWMGREYSQDISYEDRPWEKEAFEKEVILTKIFMEKNPGLIKKDIFDLLNSIFDILF